MSNQKSIQKKLSQGVSSWLLYEFHCHKGDLFNEKYISTPISGVLNTLTTPNLHLQTEVNHPGSPSGRGRPLQIDFVISNKYKNNDWMIALESKWVGRSTVSEEDILWDLIRLQNLHAKYKNIRTYFLIAGFAKKMEDLFGGLDVTTINKSMGKVTVNNTTTKFHLNQFLKKTKTHINTKIKKYKKFKFYSMIECSRPYIYPNKVSTNLGLNTCVFEVFKPNGSYRIKKL